ncbi:MAG: bifunctional phosphopantothenoylcysteine decarboxylase/phosphopantothenate--cysteine ligase CoaBC [Terriglobales bacterium]
MKIVLGVSGGIAAYKAAELARLFQQAGFPVQAVLTRAAQEFIRPLTFAALTGQKVITDLFDPALAAAAGEPAPQAVSAIEHIEAAQTAAALVVAPATAHVLAKFAHGLADDFLTTLYLATPAPVILAPAMNLEMWRHPATQANLETLRRRPRHVLVEPGAGYLACGMIGEGRLADLDAIVAATRAALAASAKDGDLAGRTVLITAGPTREAVDPVRYFSNRSSGKMGFALAAAAAGRGARVVLIAGPATAPPPEAPGIELIRVTTAAEMAEAALGRFESADLAILAAAVADYRPVAPAARKIKKTADRLRLELEPTPDILAAFGRLKKRGQVLVGFAAETGPPVAAAREKLGAKGADLIVANDVSRAGVGFDADENQVVLVGANGREQALERAPKPQIAEQILDAAAALLTRPAAVRLVRA